MERRRIWSLEREARLSQTHEAKRFVGMDYFGLGEEFSFLPVLDEAVKVLC
jgi:hypothetical protein